MLFSILLTAYSVSWMYLIRQESSVVIGVVEPEFRPIARDIIVTRVVPEGPAERAGIRAGDRIVAIDGRKLDLYDPFHELRQEGRPGQRSRFTIDRNGEMRDVSLTLLSRTDVPAMPSPDGGANAGAIVRFIGLLLSFYPIPFLVVGLVVLLQRPHDPHAWLLALMLGGFIAAPPLAEFEYRVPQQLRGPLLAFWALLNIPLPAITYAFFSVFPAHTPLDRRLPWLKVAGLVFALCVAVPVAVAIMAGHGTYVLWWLRERFITWRTTVGVVLTIYSLGFFLLAVASVAMNAFGASAVRRKTRVILLGVLVGTLPLLVLQGILGAAGRRLQELPFWFFGIAVLSLFAIPLSLGYAVVKHRAMEIPVLLRRSARYLLVRRGLITLVVMITVGVTFAFASVFEHLTRLGPMERTRAGLLAGSVFGSLMVLLGRRVWEPAIERLDRAFFRNANDARRLLVTLAEQTRTATDRTTLAEMIDESVLQALHPKTLLVFLRAGDDWTLEAAEHEGLTGEEARLPVSPVQLVELARRGRPVLINPAQLAPNGPWASLAPLQPEALVPLVGRSRQVEGLLVLGPRLSDESYSGEDVALLASVGTQAGLALENIRLAETMAEQIEAERRVTRELEIAREVQAKLLPQERPVLATLDYAGACLQARVVGGDYFDFVSIAPNHFGIVLADISGKGISAALLMASLQANLRAQYANAPHDLTKVLGLVNKVFYDSTAANHYATLFFGVYEESSRNLVYANCGHLPPVLLRESGEVERLGVTAPVVGLFEEPWQCATGATELHAGDTLVIFTDGVSEATSQDDEEFGEERLIALLQRHREMPATELLDTIVAAVREHSATEQFDDLTLIVARVR